ncbi:hypothetical protein D3C84_961650 [compost metagenome]
MQVVVDLVDDRHAALLQGGQQALKQHERRLGATGLLEEAQLKGVAILALVHTEGHVHRTVLAIWCRDFQLPNDHVGQAQIELAHGFNHA